MIIKPGIFEKFEDVICAVSTRKGGVSKEPFGMNLSYKVGDDEEAVKRNRYLFFSRVGIPEKNVVTQNQTHSANITYCDNPKHLQDNDGIYTPVRNLFLSVSIADCIPVFIYCNDKKIVAAVHSGWKGTANEITSKMIFELMTKYSVNPESIYCYIGPGISVKHYEIGKDITKNFSGESLELRDDKIFLDLKKEIFGQLTDSEIPEINIEVSGYCTFERFDLFHSYRRDGNQSGRMMGVIGMI